MIDLPTWFPWMIVGGMVFMILSFVASKYNNKPHKKSTFLQDFLSGSILIAMMGALVPDSFPTFPFSSSTVSSITSLPSSLLYSGSDDIDLQVGPLRR